VADAHSAATRAAPAACPAPLLASWADIERRAQRCPSLCTTLVERAAPHCAEHSASRAGRPGSLAWRVLAAWLRMAERLLPWLRAVGGPDLRPVPDGCGRPCGLWRRGRDVESSLIGLARVSGRLRTSYRGSQRRVGEAGTSWGRCGCCTRCSSASGPRGGWCSRGRACH
jgi:hypothetical protein